MGKRVSADIEVEMIEQRFQPRMLCADLVRIQWFGQHGPARSTMANLEDISQAGACIQVEQPIPLNSSIKLSHGRGQLRGIVRYCVFREIGYFIGLEFEPDSKWSLKQYRPKHFLDPARLGKQ